MPSTHHITVTQPLQLPVTIVFTSKQRRWKAHLYWVEPDSSHHSAQSFEFMKIVSVPPGEDKSLLGQWFSKVCRAGSKITRKRRSNWQQWTLDGSKTPLSLYRKLLSATNETVYSGPGFLNPRKFQISEAHTINDPRQLREYFRSFCQEG